MTHRLSIFAVAITVIVLAAVSAQARSTKYQSSVVPVVADNTGATAFPTMAAGKVLMKDNGKCKSKLSGVTDEFGIPVTTDNSMKLTGQMTGDEYIVVLGGNFPGMGAVFEFNIAVELKSGKGSAKVDQSSQFALIPAGVHRAAVFDKLEIYEPPLPADFAACKLVIDSSGTVIDDPNNPCKTGLMIGASGVIIP
jgi:hypothetical protein